MERTIEKIKSLILITRPEINLLAFFTVYIGALSADSTLISTPVLLSMFAVFFIAVGASPFNDYFDYEIDKIVHPNRPLPSGVIKRKTALLMGITFFSMGLIISLFINIQVFFLSIFGVTLIFLYEFVSKKTGLLGNFVVAFTISVSFLYGGAAVGDIFAPLFYASISFFILFGREILLDVKDYEGDKALRRTLPVRIGRKNAAIVGVFYLFVGIFLFFYPGLIIFDSIWYIILVIPILLTTIYSAILPLFDVENSARTTDVLRFTMVEVIVVFIILLLL